MSAGIQLEVLRESHHPSTPPAPAYSLHAPIQTPQRQQICAAEQTLRGVRAADDLAQSLGAQLGEREVLLYRLPTPAA